MTIPHTHSNLSNVLEKLRILGGTVSTDGERLTLTFPEEAGREVEPLLGELRERKSEVLTLLAWKALIAQTNLQIADAWDMTEPSEGDNAWEWILRGSKHGRLIEAAEDHMNAIGSQGDPAALRAACEAFVTAWRDGIAAWKRANSRTRGEQRSLDLNRLDRINEENGESAD